MAAAVARESVTLYEQEACEEACAKYFVSFETMSDEQAKTGKLQRQVGNLLKTKQDSELRWNWMAFWVDLKAPRIARNLVAWSHKRPFAPGDRCRGGGQ